MDRDPSLDIENERERSLSDPDRLTRMIKLLLLLTAILVAVGAGIAYWLNKKSEEDTESWNYYGALRGRYDTRRLGSDWEPSASATENRDAYQGALEKFLEKRPGKWDDAMEPHVRWRVAKAALDQLVAGENIDDPDARKVYFDRAQKHLEAIRDAYPDFPLNWEECRANPEGAPTLTRQLLEWLEANREWERKYRATSLEPDGDVTLLVRTDRGDLRIRCYGERAKALVDAVVHEATKGTYDGRAIVTKQVDGTDEQPYRSTLHTGNERSTSSVPYDWKTLKDVTEVAAPQQLLPVAARHHVLADRGVVMAWHEPISPYDEPSQLVFVVQRSPVLDHNFSPIGKMTDEGSLATMDRIFAGDTWADEEDVKADDDYTKLSTALQVPARIVKVLTYRKNTLVASTATDGGHVPPTDAEKSLTSIKPDAYKTDPPKKPSSVTDTPDDGNENKDNENSDQGNGAKGAGGSSSDGASNEEVSDDEAPKDGD